MNGEKQFKELSKALCEASGCHHKCHDTEHCVVEDEAAEKLTPRNCKRCIYVKVCTLHLRDDDASRCPLYNDDVVAVVRCADCVHALTGPQGSLHCELGFCAVTADDFCSFGERKERGS